eukprot:1188887-Prorocentrum_minimum.AAC.1
MRNNRERLRCFAHTPNPARGSSLRVPPAGTSVQFRGTSIHATLRTLPATARVYSKESKTPKHWHPKRHLLGN